MVCTFLAMVLALSCQVVPVYPKSGRSFLPSVGNEMLQHRRNYSGL